MSDVSENEIGYVGVWRAVISQAITDATVPSTHPVENRQAREWLTSRSRDFFDVCALADLDPERVSAFARDAIDKADKSGQKAFTRKQKRPESKRVFLRDRCIEIDGVKRTLAEWSELSGAPVNLIYKRFIADLSPDEILYPGRIKRGRRLAERLLPDNAVNVTRGRAAKLYEHDGESLTIYQWASRTGIGVPTLRQRMGRNRMTLSQAIMFQFQPTAPLYHHDGRSMSLKQWAEHSGIKAKTLASRLAAGKTFGEAITAPMRVKLGRPKSRAA